MPLAALISYLFEELADAHAHMGIYGGLGLFVRHGDGAASPTLTVDVYAELAEESLDSRQILAKRRRGLRPHIKPGHPFAYDIFQYLKELGGSPFPGGTIPHQRYDRVGDVIRSERFLDGPALVRPVGLQKGTRFPGYRVFRSYAPFREVGHPGRIFYLSTGAIP